MFSWLRKKKVMPPKLSQEPLREFVYLDEVSLRSLLSSQTGEVVDSTSKQTEDIIDAEVGSKIAAEVPLVASSELTSRFQTSNSSTLQTSRKATVQSWFRDFYNIPNLRLIEPVVGVEAIADVDALTTSTIKSIVVKSSDLERGKLVEFRVKLSPDPIFHLGTMVSEFTGMADDYPEMFAENNANDTLREVQPINKILQRLLAGLIPVRAEAIDYVVVELDHVEYVVHRDAISGLQIETKALVVVGVTDHLAYWKDIRRVLFSDAEFTILCRISRSSLQSSWTPVKLADLFKELVPDLVSQMATVSQQPFNTGIQKSGSNMGTSGQLIKALFSYRDHILSAAEKTLTDEQEGQLREVILDQLDRAETASEQRNSFNAVAAKLDEFLHLELASSEHLELREASREIASLPHFPSLQVTSTAQAITPVVAKDTAQPRLLDVEVVAIYW
jgi:hypothetical protein